jgi:peroxiredoxin Q/BCP
MLQVKDKAIDFCLPDENEKEHCLKDFKGSWLVLYFYPKDNTSGCTKEAVGFSENLEEFKKLNCEIVGISPDTPKKHKNFIEKHNLKVMLLSDIEHKVLENYGAWGKKKMYGREYFGVIRSTYLINPEGLIVKIWNKVKVTGHMENVLKTLKENV